MAMVRFVQMLGVLALLCAGIVFALCSGQFQAAPEVRQDAELSIIEKFARSGRTGGQTGRQAPSPLIQQAQAFAVCLDPPVLLKQFPKAALPENKHVAIERPNVTSVEVSPKFELHGISYYRSKPEESMALVWEPGGGYRWIKQGATLGHFVVEDVRSTSVIYRDGRRTHEMAFAPDQITTRVANSHNDEPPPGRPGAPDRASPKPSPPQGIRKTPTRVAAKSTSG